MSFKKYLDKAKTAAKQVAKSQVTKDVVNTAIKNSELIQPYVKQKHYRRGVIALNVLHFLLRKMGDE